MLFEAVSSEYELGRPSYPELIFADFINSVGKSQSSENYFESALEIGSGSGQATAALAEMAGRLDCIEPGEKFVDLLHGKFGHLESVSIHRTDFERFETRTRYDLVASACALHWIPKEYFYNRIHSLFRPHGWFLGLWHQPHFSKLVREIIQETVAPKFADFSIPTYKTDTERLFDEGFRDFSDRRGFSNCQKKLYISERKLSALACSALIWSYVNIGHLSKRDRLSLQESLTKQLEKLSSGELCVQDHFPVAWGQSSATI